MHGVGVVRGEHEALGQLFQIGPLIQPQSRRDPAEGVRQQRGVRALPGGGADLLVVKHHMDWKALTAFALQEAGQGGERALGVIQPRAGEEFPLCPPDAGGLPVIDKEVMVQHIRRVRAGLLRQQGYKIPGLRPSVKRQQVPLDPVLIPGIDLPIHVDSQARD